MAANNEMPADLASITGVKHLFLEQRSPAGSEENEITLTFNDTRKGIASWLADSGSGGAAEYLPADVLAGAYVSMREPGQLFGELTELLTKQEPDFQSNLTELEQKLGAGFVGTLASALGTEAAFGVQGLSTSGPTWMLAGLANDPGVIDSSIAKIVETANAELDPAKPELRVVLGEENINGRVWKTMKASGLPFGVTWTYDGGYMVAASDRAIAERAIATRNGGSALVWSTQFQSQLPASAGIHPSAFAWLNTQGALGLLTALTASPATNELLANRDPILIVLNGKPEQIHVASRTRVSGAILDLMLLGFVPK